MQTQIDDIVDAQSLNFWLNFLGTQGGTIHQIHDWMNTRYKQFNWITDKESKKIAKRWNTRRPRPGREIFHVPTKCYDDRCNQTMILGKDNQGNYFLAVYNEKQERVK